MRAAKQQAACAVFDLVQYAADRTGDDRPRLPHRFGYRQSEAFLQAFLHNYGGVPLQRVDDGGVLFDVGHRQAGQMHAVPLATRQISPRPLNFMEDLLSFGIIGHGLRAGAGEDEVCVCLCGDVLRKSQHHAERIFETIPAGNVNDDRRIEARRRTGAPQVAGVIDAAP